MDLKTKLHPRCLFQLTMYFIVGCLISCSTDSLPTTGNGDQKAETDSVQTSSPSPEGDVVGKILTGYQGWFGCVGDSSPFNGWRHWSGNGQSPAPGNQTFELWPDTREYENTYTTGYDSLGNGNAARLFSNWDDQTVNLHFKWMKDYEIDCAAVQRFGNYLNKDPRDRDFKNELLIKEREAAEAHNVKFFVWYDISGWDNFQTEIKTDWTNTVASNTSSSMYARQNNKPVVCIWGPGVSGRPGNVNSWGDVIDWFKGQGCYVIVGTDRNWRNDSTNMPAFNKADMISPWTVGSFGDPGGADDYASVMEADKIHCDANGQDYLPVVFPGFAWSNWNGGPQNEKPRLHGDLMWRQFANIRNMGITQTFIAMFDEYDEATAIAKAAEDNTMIPSDQYFLTLDADGVQCSSDFYLRLTQDGGKMIKEEIPLVWEHPTSHE